MGHCLLVSTGVYCRHVTIKNRIDWPSSVLSTKSPLRSGTKMGANSARLCLSCSSILHGGPGNRIRLMRLALQFVTNDTSVGVTLRSTQLIMPAVTLFCRCRGLPRASTHSPARRPLEVPSLTAGKGCLLITCRTARSETLQHAFAYEWHICSGHLVHARAPSWAARRYRLSYCAA